MTLALDGGVTLLQLREKDLTARRLLPLAHRLRDITRWRALLFINDRVDVALACGADGVQLGEEAMPVRAARQVSADRLLVGRSVHGVEGAMAAEAEGADLLLVGMVFSTRSHPGIVPAGVDLLTSVRNSVRIPFLAIGGVKAGNVASVVEAGASGAAVISAIAGSDDPAEASRLILRSMKTAWAAKLRTGAARPA